MTTLRGFEVMDNYKEGYYSEGDLVPVPIPQRATDKSAGYDLRSVESYYLNPGDMVIVRTGLTVYMQQDEFLDVRIRSGLAAKNQLTLQNDAGVIDADYYGKEIMVMIRNESPFPFRIYAGDRIAQGIFAKYLVTDNDKPVENNRTGGFGSTGTK